MEIKSVTNSTIYSANVSDTINTQPAIEQEKPIEAIGNESVKNIEPTDAEQDTPKGVIRNLINGHFKGVSDVRLRINFGDEIAELEEAALAKATESGLASISETLNSQINTALGSEDMDEATSVLIASAMDHLNNEISQFGTNSYRAEEMLSDLRTSFDKFVRTINPVVEEPVENEIPADNEIPSASAESSNDIPAPETEKPADEIQPETSPQFSLEQFLTDLTATFLSELELFETALANTGVLPEISGPNGNGKAFDKFLAIYNEMQNNAGTNAQNNMISDIDILL